MPDIQRKVATLLTLTALMGGCGDTLHNLTASLGGNTAGGRGTIRVLFINNTDFRAVFTAGTFDQTDRLSVPDFIQFSPDAGDETLDGDAESDILELACGRVFSIGSPRLLEFIEVNVDEEEGVEEAFVEGVEFFETGTGDADPTLRGNAAPFEALLGADFPCNALLIIYLEPADAGPDAFRVDFELIPSESTR